MKKILSIVCSCFLVFTAVFAVGCDKNTDSNPSEPPVFSEEMRELIFDTPKAQKWSEIADLDLDVEKGEVVVNIGMYEDQGKDDYAGYYFLSGIKTAAIDIGANCAKYNIHFFDKASYHPYPVVNKYFQDVLDLMFYETEFIDSNEARSDISGTQMFEIQNGQVYYQVSIDGYLRCEYEVDGVSKYKRSDKKVNAPYLTTIAFFSMLSESYNGNTDVQYSVKEKFDGLSSNERNDYSVKLTKNDKEVDINGADFDVAWSSASAYKCSYAVNEAHKEKTGDYIEATFTYYGGSCDYVITPNGDMYLAEQYTTIDFHRLSHPCMGMFADITLVYCGNVDYSSVSAFFNDAA